MLGNYLEERGDFWFFIPWDLILWKQGKMALWKG